MRAKVASMRKILNSTPIMKKKMLRFSRFMRGIISNNNKKMNHKMHHKSSRGDRGVVLLRK